jgi:hypothetical protein
LRESTPDEQSRPSVICGSCISLFHASPLAFRPDFVYYQTLFQNFSFGTATLDLIEKAGFRPLFRKPVPKLTEFWNRLIILEFFIMSQEINIRPAVEGDVPLIPRFIRGLAEYEHLPDRVEATEEG